MSLAHLRNLTCVADVCSYVPNLDNSVVRDCGDMQLGTGDTGTARCAPGYVLGVGDTEQTFSCQPDGVVSGTQPVCELLPCSAQKGDSEYRGDVCINRADERSCMVSCASDCPIVGGPAVWTCMTNDSWTDGSLSTCEPQVCADLSFGSSVASDGDGTLHSHTWTVFCASGHVASDMDDAVLKCLAPPGIPDGTLPRCVLLVCTGQEFDGMEVVAHTCKGIDLGDNCGRECAHGVAETYPCVWNDRPSLKINNPPLMCSSECSLASVPPASANHDCDGLALQEECTATGAESYDAKSSAIASTAQICHFDGYTYADTGLQL